MKWKNRPAGAGRASMVRAIQSSIGLHCGLCHVSLSCEFCLWNFNAHQIPDCNYRFYQCDTYMVSRIKSRKSHTLLSKIWRVFSITVIPLHDTFSWTSWRQNISSIMHPFIKHIWNTLTLDFYLSFNTVILFIYFSGLFCPDKDSQNFPCIEKFNHL